MRMRCDTGIKSSWDGLNIIWDCDELLDEIRRQAGFLRGRRNWREHAICLELITPAMRG